NSRLLPNLKKIKGNVGTAEILKNLKMHELEDLSKYEWKEIGKGGQATVYTVKKEINGIIRKVAAKMYTKGSRAEIAMLKRNHPNILEYLLPWLLLDLFIEGT
ncbi:hypothetical protein PMAYCL1PPCAC_00766, partial [Pristionchus mayeri]